MSKTDAARARWRADLHEFGSSALKKAGLDEMAAGSEDEIKYLRAYAVLMDELANAKEAYYSNSTDAAKAVLHDVKLRVHQFRSSAVNANRPTPGVVNNISEPSDAELVKLGY